MDEVSARKSMGDKTWLLRKVAANEKYGTHAGADSRIDEMQNKGEWKLMKLNEPKCCGDCFFKNEWFDLPFCDYQMQTIQPKTNARLDVAIDLASVPNWCPIRKTNKMIEELPIEKQMALDSISNGLQILFGAGGTNK